MCKLKLTRKILTYVCKFISLFFFSTNFYANYFQWTFLPHCTLNNDWQYVGAQSRFPFLTLTVSLSLFLWLPLTPLNPADAHPPTVWPPIALAPTKTDNPTNANKPKSTKEEREREQRKREKETEKHELPESRLHRTCCVAPPCAWRSRFALCAPNYFLHATLCPHFTPHDNNNSNSSDNK